MAKKFSKIEVALSQSYFKMIENGVGSNLFRNFYIRQGDKKQDAVQGGKLSCAFFVSTILNNFNLIKQPHLTVKSTLEDMQKMGWSKIKKLKKGAIILWETKDDHSHLGFYIGNNKAISNNPIKKQPIIHHYTFGPRGDKSYRQITAVFWHKKLDK
ncbi:MAG: NlpC/P60 family protein [Patescibacteria group bacterium]|nr:NlpC/P60 family protein [Patescibacteria group bacterium]MDD5164713.1 NlpC/P60 family protein [Patescibacteria group bacterium]MDD5534189.1 NlpC/P60 family protein [Patescibacteria group bacterium]